MSTVLEPAPRAASISPTGPSGTAADGYVRACDLAELQREGTLTISTGPAGGGRVGAMGQTLALFWHEEQAFAVDNRCPHMGFPLSKGFCKDGILTCYWHYARFDLKSGGTFDPFADDVRTFPTRIRDGAVWVCLAAQRDIDAERARWTQRLYGALDQQVSLVQAKSILSLLDLSPSATGGAAREIVSSAASYGLRYGSGRNGGGWGDGLTILTGMALLQEDLAPEERALALYHGTRRVGDDASARVERVKYEPLPMTNVEPRQLKRWFREFVEVRDAVAAERALCTAIEAGWTPTQLIDLLAAAATDHYYRDFSHVMDTLAHAASLLDVIGWDRTTDVLPSLVAQWAAATRQEENNSWRHPKDLAGMVAARIPLLDQAIQSDAPTSGLWEGNLVEVLLGDDPEASLDAVMDALRGGVSVADATQALAYASVLRLARFPTSNEFGDWDTALHAFTYCASLAQVAQRAPSPELARAILDGAMVVYQTRFLNVPAARLPGERALAAMPTAPDALLRRHSELAEGQGGVDEAGAVAYRYLTMGHDPAALIRQLGHVTLREDCGFHDFQMLEEGIRLAKDLLALGTPDKQEAAFQTLVAITRWQTAHAPTRRAVTQTYDIARRLHRGEAVYEESAS